MLTLLTLALISTLPLTAEGGGRMSEEEELMLYLFKDYNPSARPVISSFSTVNVQMMFSLLHIQDLVS